MNSCDSNVLISIVIDVHLVIELKDYVFFGKDKTGRFLSGWGFLKVELHDNFIEQRHVLNHNSSVKLPSVFVFVTRWMRYSFHHLHLILLLLIFDQVLSRNNRYVLFALRNLDTDNFICFSSLGWKKLYGEGIALFLESVAIVHLDFVNLSDQELAH